MKAHLSLCLVPVRKWLFSPISLLDEKNYPRNINNMPAVIFSVRLDLVENTGIYLPSVKNYLISGQTLPKSFTKMKRILKARIAVPSGTIQSGP